jgi:hypothetical protein
MHMVKAMLICICDSGNGRKDRFWKRDVLCQQGDFCNGRKAINKSSMGIEGVAEYFKNGGKPEKTAPTSQQNIS